MKVDTPSFFLLLRDAYISALHWPRKMAISNIERRNHTEFVLHFIWQKASETTRVQRVRMCDDFFPLLINIIIVASLLSLMYIVGALRCRREKKSSLAPRMCIISVARCRHTFVVRECESDTSELYTISKLLVGHTRVDGDDDDDDRVRLRAYGYVHVQQSSLSLKALTLEIVCEFDFAHSYTRESRAHISVQSIYDSASWYVHTIHSHRHARLFKETWFEINIRE